jgi:putative colanic acid biosynthesis glycosyltransferase
MECSRSIGHKHTEESAEWCSTADVFLKPSMEETLGLTTGEAMSCGAPVIVYDSTASSELISGTANCCVRLHGIHGVMRCMDEIMIN